MLKFTDFITFVDEVTTLTSEKINIIFDSNINNPRLKEDGSPVTEADIFVEEFIRQQISYRFTDHDIIGEELTDKMSNNLDMWIIDPIDGTFNFVRGVPMFGTLVGYLYENRPIYGSLRLPRFNNDLIVGNNEICLLNNSKIVTSRFEGWSNALILTTDEGRVLESKISKEWQNLKMMGSNFRTWGDCYGYYLVCHGKADAMLDLDLKSHDIMPLIPILRGAGVSIIDLSEKNDYSSIIACKPEIEDEMKMKFLT